MKKVSKEIANVVTNDKHDAVAVVSRTNGGEFLGTVGDVKRMLNGFDDDAIIRPVSKSSIAIGVSTAPTTPDRCPCDHCADVSDCEGCDYEPDNYYEENDDAGRFGFVPVPCEFEQHFERTMPEYAGGVIQAMRNNNIGVADAIASMAGECAYNFAHDLADRTLNYLTEAIAHAVDAVNADSYKDMCRIVDAHEHGKH